MAADKIPLKNDSRAALMQAAVSKLLSLIYNLLSCTAIAGS
jgi:hypothetical protein